MIKTCLGRVLKVEEGCLRRLSAHNAGGGQAVGWLCPGGSRLEHRWDSDFYRTTL